MTEIASDLFSWAERLPPEKVVSFRSKREELPRWHAISLQPLAGYDRAVARQRGKLAPAPILPFPRRHPASPGTYMPASVEGVRA